MFSSQNKPVLNAKPMKTGLFSRESARSFSHGAAADLPTTQMEKKYSNFDMDLDALSSEDEFDVLSLSPEDARSHYQRVSVSFVLSVLNQFLDRQISFEATDSISLLQLWCSRPSGSRTSSYIHVLCL